MLNKEFKQINKKKLINFGFEYNNKKYYLKLSNIIIRLQYISYPHDSGVMIAYDIIIPKISNHVMTNLVDVEKAFEDVSEIPVQMPALKNMSVKVGDDVFTNVFIPLQIDSTFWEIEFENALVKTFGLFKNNDLLRMKNIVFTDNTEDYIIVNNKVKSFLLNIIK